MNPLPKRSDDYDDIADRFIDSVCDDSMRATAAIIRKKSLEVANYEALTDSLRDSVKAEILPLWAELKDAMDANMPNSMLLVIYKSTCSVIAIRALRNIGLLAKEEK